MKNLHQFLCDLIAIKSVTGEEHLVLEFTSKFLESHGFVVDKMLVADNRYNIYCKVGDPKVCFTTHLDVVPAPDSLFIPRIENTKIIGRGSCDAKGMVAAMIFAAINLKNEGFTDFALLFVVGEEDDGIGAKTAAKQLVGAGLKYVINGEPTECKLIKAHKGGISFFLTTKGVSVHSGYPERGVDANATLIEIAYDLMKADFGTDEVLGKATINLGKIEGGVASNVVSNSAKLKGQIRTVTSNEYAKSVLEKVVNGRGDIDISGDAPKVQMKTLDGFETDVVSYCTDIPYLLPIAQEFLLYGPGSIFEAHTVNEFIDISQLEQAVEDYQRIYKALIV